jgi:hypothetical protein
MEDLPHKPERPPPTSTTASNPHPAGFGSPAADLATTGLSGKFCWLPAGVAAVGSHALFALLIAFDIVRTLRHAMWRDELEIFLVASSSSSLWDLLAKLKYQADPALWFALVWLITRVTADPVWMQVLHIGLAIGVWSVVYVWSPFSRLEKILLLLSYFLFWEYFVVSRSYVLIALIAFAFIAVRERRPRPELVLWLLLGLLANVHAFGTIWSMVLAAMLVMEGARRRTVPVVGAAVYLALLVFAISTMMPAADFRMFGQAPPAADFTLWGHGIWFSFSRFYADLSTPIGAFMPLSFAAVRQAVAFIAHPAVAAIPDFWNLQPTAELVALTQADTEHPVRLALVFAAPVAACWLVTRDARLVFEFTLVYAGIVLFENIWSFPGGARHHGIVFLAFVAAAWSAWARRSPSIWSRRLFAAILLVNACGGLLSLASELRPFSEGRDAAAWIEQNDLADAFFIASRDGPGLTVAGYLRRPVYFLGCECNLPVANASRKVSLSSEEFGQRLTKAVALAGQHDAILISTRLVVEGELKLSAPTLSLTLLASFTNAETGEDFWIYRVTVQQLP